MFGLDPAMLQQIMGMFGGGSSQPGMGMLGGASARPGMGLPGIGAMPAGMAPAPGNTAPAPPQLGPAAAAAANPSGGMGQYMPMMGMAGGMLSRMGQGQQMPMAAPPPMRMGGMGMSPGGALGGGTGGGMLGGSAQAVNPIAAMLARRRMAGGL